MRSLLPALVTVPCLVAGLSAQIGYTTDFENFAASAAGTPAAGQDGFYVPAVAGSIDSNIFTYAGNPLGVPANPNGGANFFGGLSGGTNLFARSQRTLALPPAPCRVTISFDVCASFNGTVTPTNNVGSFSFQPSGTNVFVNLLARWPTGVTLPPTTWNADFVLGPTAAGVQTTFPDANFLNLPVNVWHRWSCTVDMQTGEHVEFAMTNGATNVTTVFTPTTSMPLPNQGMPLPTDFRLFTGGTAAGNIFAVDNLEITYGAAYQAFGNGGCSGTLGAPTLTATSLPRLGSTLTVNLGNLPLSAGIMVTGFSNTLAAGAFPLPLDLGMFGYPGCFLLADPVSTQFLVGSGNMATWNLTIPSAPSYLGVQFYNQGISLDTGTPLLSVTNGAHGCLGR